MDTQKILIVDDDVTICEIISENLTQHGFIVLDATEGETGLEIAQKEKPDCIILDWALPGMDGMDVLKSLKDNGATKDIPVIMLTAKTEISNVSESLAFGALDYIVKPFDHNNLLERVKQALAR